jgi:hypothetical protein
VRGQTKGMNQATRAACTFVGLVTLLAVAPVSRGAPTVFVAPPERIVALGDTFGMSVRIDGGTDTLTCFLVRFEFDPAVIVLESAGEGSLFTQCGFPTMYNWDVLSPGEHSCNDVTLGPWTYALCPGELVHLSFTAASLGETPIEITAVDLRDIRRLKILPVLVAPGHVVVGPESGIHDGGGAALRAFPNPSRIGRTIAFSVPRASAAEVSIFDVRGRLVARRPVGVGPSGGGQAEWDGRDTSGRAVSSGIYFAVLDSGGSEGCCRLAVLR